MITRSIEKDDWKSYFDDFSKHIQSERVELDVVSLDLGDQIADDYTALNGVSYDPKDEMIYIFTYPLRHFIAQPEQVWIVEEKNRIRSIEIETVDGTKHVIALRELGQGHGHIHDEPRIGFDELEAIP